MENFILTKIIYDVGTENREYLVDNKWLQNLVKYAKYDFPIINLVNNNWNYSQDIKLMS